MANVLGFIQKAFPFIHAAASLGGPAAVMAADLVGKAIGANKKVDPTPDGIAQAIQDAGFTPEQRAALLQANQAAEAELQKMGFQHIEDVLKLINDDRASARDMQEKNKSWIPGALALTIVLGFFALLGGMMFGKLHPADNQALLLLLGSLTMGFGAVVSYYFGSSAGSDRKTEILANQAK